MAHDVVIKNGNVIDGSGSPAFQADVAIDGDKITAIGKNLGDGKKEIIPTWMRLSCSIPTAIRW
jgi:N-acyl-D-aspartate/D-glutamate deacylase